MATDLFSLVHDAQRLEAPWFEIPEGVVIVEAPRLQDLIADTAGEPTMSFGRLGAERQAIAWREVRRLLAVALSLPTWEPRMRAALSSAQLELARAGTVTPERAGFVLGTSVLVRTLFLEAPPAVTRAILGYCHLRSVEGASARVASVRRHVTYGRARRAIARWIEQEPTDNGLLRELLPLLQRGYSSYRVADCVLVVATAIAGPPSAAVASLLSVLALNHRRSFRPVPHRVVKEVLRVAPPVWLTARTLQCPGQLAGRTLMAGETMYLSAFLAHHRESAFPEPFSFRPDRWIDRPMSRLYFPYGVRSASCLGVKLSNALLEQIASDVLTGALIVNVRHRTPAKRVGRFLFVSEGPLDVAVA